MAGNFLQYGRQLRPDSEHMARRATSLLDVLALRPPLLSNSSCVRLNK
jgi:hypothetical protein